MASLWWSSYYTKKAIQISCLNYPLSFSKLVLETKISFYPFLLVSEVDFSPLSRTLLLHSQLYPFLVTCPINYFSSFYHCSIYKKTQILLHFYETKQTQPTNQPMILPYTKLFSQVTDLSLLSMTDYKTAQRNFIWWLHAFPTTYSLVSQPLKSGAAAFTFCTLVLIPFPSFSTDNQPSSWISRSLIFHTDLPKSLFSDPGVTFLTLSATRGNCSSNPLLRNELTSTENHLILKYLFRNDPSAYIHLFIFTSCWPSSSRKPVITPKWLCSRLNCSSFWNCLSIFIQDIF